MHIELRSRIGLLSPLCLGGRKERERGYGLLPLKYSLHGTCSFISFIDHTQHMSNDRMNVSVDFIDNGERRSVGMSPLRTTAFR